MLTYPEGIEERLEIDQVKKFISAQCATELAAERVLTAKPITKFETLVQFLDQTREMIRLLGSDEKPGSRSFTDLAPFLKKLFAGGTFLTGEDLSVLKSGLVAMNDWSVFLKKRQKEYPQLVKLALGFVTDNDLVGEIDSKIDERGEVRDNATPELTEIRRSRFAAERQVRKSIQKILDRSKKEEFTDDEGTVTIRGGRLVIPVKAEYKRKLPGFIHDESSTGQTVFMEPTEVLDLNNQVRELTYQEQREIVKILTALADRIRERLQDLRQGNDFVIRIDFIVAKALFARDFACEVPRVINQSKTAIINGFHPVLWHKNQSLKKATVPLTISWSGDQRIVVISGPNAGGKSVALKTAGILQYALQCGFPVPVSEESEFGVFRNFFVDIGDSQSLENDLSTYSSHLQAMKYFCEFADKSTLVLIDEFGTGTEPQFGGAIAQAILNKLSQTKCRGVITTHYGNLKEFADSSPGLINAAMRYDLDRLEPLFQLEIGKPGNSFALEIAEKIGIQKAVLKEAKQSIGYDQVNYNKLLSKLDRERSKLEKANVGIEEERTRLASLRQDYEALRAMVETDRKKVLKEAKKEALQIVKNANKEVEKTIREIKEKGAEKTHTKELRENLSKSADALKKQIGTEKKAVITKEPIKTPVAIGDQVRLGEDGAIGEVLAMKGKQAEVLFGGLKSFVKIDRLVPISKRQAKKDQRSKIKGLDLNQRRADFSYELDVRGKRAEEVLPMLDKMLDDALILGTTELRILHGKGHGILKELIRNHLKADKNVSHFSDEHADRGGSGITLVTLQ